MLAHLSGRWHSVFTGVSLVQGERHLTFSCETRVRFFDLTAAEIAAMIVAKSTAAGVREAVMDPAFIKEMLLSVAKNWNGADAGKVELKALLPEADRAKLDEAFGKSAQELLSAGIEVGYSKEVKTGFKVGAKEGGYYISFSDADFDALLGEYLREKVSDMLFKA